MVSTSLLFFDCASLIVVVVVSVHVATIIFTHQNLFSDFHHFFSILAQLDHILLGLALFACLRLACRRRRRLVSSSSSSTSISRR